MNVIGIDDVSLRSVGWFFLNNVELGISAFYVEHQLWNVFCFVFVVVAASVIAVFVDLHETLFVSVIRRFFGFQFLLFEFGVL